jgi:DNA-binding ferritin-like protein
MTRSESHRNKESNMNCTICSKRIVLVPSAAERARKFGGKPSDYARLFTTHAACQVAKRDQEARDLLRSLLQAQRRTKE